MTELGDSLRELATLKADGILSDAEFDAEKQKLLNGPAKAETAKTTSVRRTNPEALAAAKRAENKALGLVIPINHDGFAIAASYIALFSLVVPLLGLVAAGLGWLALKRIAKDEDKGGAFRAYFAVGLGAISSIGWSILLMNM